MLPQLLLSTQHKTTRTCLQEVVNSSDLHTSHLLQFGIFGVIFAELVVEGYTDISIQFAFEPWKFSIYSTLSRNVVHMVSTHGVTLCSGRCMLLQLDLWLLLVKILRA
jgi:hypothetical protein